MIDQHNNKKINIEWKWVLIGIFASVVFYLIVSHRAHLIANTSYIFFALFILMHFFMHRGHGGHGGHEKNNGDNSQHHHDKSDNNQKT